MKGENDLAIAANRYALAQQLVGPKPAELAQWAHDNKVELIAGALGRAFRAGKEVALAAIQRNQPKWWVQCPVNDGTTRIATGDGEQPSMIVWVRVYNADVPQDDIARLICAAVNAYSGEEEKGMPWIIKEPPGHEAECKACRAVIGYLPEYVERGTRTVMTETESYARVKCPRQGCPGYAYVERT